MWEFTVSDNFDETDSGESEARLDTHGVGNETISFGDYSVLAPGVQIILQGRAVSNSGS